MTKIKFKSVDTAFNLYEKNDYDSFVTEYNSLDTNQVPLFIEKMLSSNYHRPKIESYVEQQSPNALFEVGQRLLAK